MTFLRGPFCARTEFARSGNDLIRHRRLGTCFWISDKYRDPPRTPACGTMGSWTPVKRSWPLGKISRRRLDAGLEHVERIEAARFAVGWKKDPVSAALDRSDNHEIIRQVKNIDAEVRMFCAKLSPHAGFEVFGCVRITKDRLAFSEKPADLDQRARIGGWACARREVGNGYVAFFPHRDV